MFNNNFRFVTRVQGRNLIEQKKKKMVISRSEAAEKYGTIFIYEKCLHNVKKSC